MWSNPLAGEIFSLTRVTRIFQKNVFSKTAPAGPGGTPLGIFCFERRVLLKTRRDAPKPARPGRAGLMQPMAAGSRGPGPGACFGLFFTTNTATSTCPRRIGLEPRRDRGLRRRQLRRQQHLAAGGRQIGHLRSRLGLRRRPRPGVEHGVSEPVGELLAAAIVRRSRRLRFAFRAVGRADEPNVEVKVMPPPRLHFAEPTAVAAGIAA